MIILNFEKKVKKDTYIKIRLTKEEKKKLKEYCLSHNLTISEYIIKLIRNDIFEK